MAPRKSRKYGHINLTFQMDELANGCISGSRLGAPLRSETALSSDLSRHMVKVKADHATHAPCALTVSSRAVVTAWLRSGMYSKRRSLRHASGVQSVEASPPLQLEGAPAVPVQRIGGLEAHDEAQGCAEEVHDGY